MMTKTKILERKYSHGAYRGLAEVQWDDSIKSTITRKKNPKKGEWPFIGAVICGCCGRDYRGLAVEIASIEGSGYCSWCSLYKQGKVNYIHFVEEAPIDDILNEIIKRNYSSHETMMNAELYRLVTEIRSLHAQQERNNY